MRKTDAHKGLTKLVEDFAVTCPIIISLSSPSMRERHWAEIMKVVAKELPLPSNNPHMRLEQLLEMKLHVHASGVEEIAGIGNALLRVRCNAAANRVFLLTRFCILFARLLVLCALKFTVTARCSIPVERKMGESGFQKHSNYSFHQLTILTCSFCTSFTTSPILLYLFSSPFLLSSPLLSSL